MERAAFTKSGKDDSSDKKVIRDLLAHCAIPRDALPYSKEFEDLKKEFSRKTKQEVDDHQFWRTLANVAKKGSLATKVARKRSTHAPRLSQAEQLEILRLFPEGIGGRDALPYTPRFDELHGRFVKRTQQHVSKNEFWRAVSRVAKRSIKPKPIYETVPLGGLPRELVADLEVMNPWWRGQPLREIEPFRRWAFDEALRRLDAGIAPIVAIRGPRRIGKSVIQQQLVEHLLLERRIPPERILRVQFDELPSLGSFQQPMSSIIRWYEDEILKQSINALARDNKDVFLLFDEIQDLPSWHAQVKSIVDHIAAKALISGSSALRIHRERNSLAGRISTIDLGPLRLQEVAKIGHLGVMEPFQKQPAVGEWLDPDFWLDLNRHGHEHRAVLRKCFQRFAALGGFPICHKNGDTDLASLSAEVVNSVVNRTIDHEPLESSERVNRDVLREVFRYLCRRTAQSITHKRIAAEVQAILGGGVSEAGVRSAIRFLDDSMLIHTIAPLEMLQKKQASSAKLCLCDHFVRRAMLQESVPLDPSELKSEPQAVATLAGHLVEGIMASFLKRVPGVELSWFPERDQEPEIDFILTIGVKRIPVEVKYKRGRLARTECKGIYSFCGKEHYNAPFGLVITQDFAGRINRHVVAVPASRFLLLI